MVKVTNIEVRMDIKQQELQISNFNTYGEAIFIKQDQKPDSSGEGWQCWYPLSAINQKSDFSFGIVLSKPKFLGTKFLERHLDREEFVIALDHPIIQVVGLSDLDKPDCPDIKKTEAFLIKPGQMVKINAGIWHSAGIAIDDISSLYLFMLGKPTKDPSFVDSGLVQFASGDFVAIK
jgi:ureidoglycolate hydrolase